MEQKKIIGFIYLMFVLFPHWECIIAKISPSLVWMTDVLFVWACVTALFHCILIPFYFIVYCPCLFTKWFKPFRQFNIIVRCRWPWCCAKIRCYTWVSGARRWCWRAIFVVWCNAKCFASLLFNASVKYIQVYNNYQYWLARF